MRRQSIVAESFGLISDIGGSIEMGIGNAANLQLGGSHPDRGAAERVPRFGAGRVARNGSPVLITQTTWLPKRSPSKTARCWYRTAPASASRLTRRRFRLTAMTEVAILGAGSGGLAAAADLVSRGHTIRLYNRSEAPLETIRVQGGIQASGAVGGGLAVVHTVTTSLEEAVGGAEAILVVLPATAHGDIARALADQGAASPIILNPGHMCGSLHVRRVFEAAGRKQTVAELGTMTYVSRSLAPGMVDVYLRAAGVPFSTVPDNNEVAHLVEDLLPGQSRATHPMEVWFWDVNMVLHPPGMILGAARIESSGGEFLFYSEGITNSVEAVMARLDEERVEVARAFGAVVPRLAEAMATIGTADAEAARAGKLGDAIRGGTANATIKAPPRARPSLPARGHPVRARPAHSSRSHR